MDAGCEKFVFRQVFGCVRVLLKQVLPSAQACYGPHYSSRARQNNAVVSRFFHIWSVLSQYFKVLTRLKAK
jgi:hypothetical protein